MSAVEDLLSCEAVAWCLLCLGRVRNDGIMITLNRHCNCCALFVSVRLGRTERFIGNNNSQHCHQPKTDWFVRAALVLGCLVVWLCCMCFKTTSAVVAPAWLPCFDFESTAPLTMDSPWGLAGSIPTEVGKLVNMTTVSITHNKLNGTSFFDHWFLVW